VINRLFHLYIRGELFKWIQDNEDDFTEVALLNKNTWNNGEIKKRWFVQNTKLAQIPPEIWMTLPLEAKKWLLNERKLQQQEDDKIKNSLALSKSTAITIDKDTNNSNLPNQYARVKM
jgi:hypothetical protein